MIIRTKPSKKDIDLYFKALDILSGRITKKPDYKGYAAACRELEKKSLRHDEYERRKKELAERYGV